MDLYLQFGHGMMEHCRHLVRSWAGGTVILSPRDLKREQLVKLSEEIRALQGGQVLLDPQFYVPRSDHHRLTAHDYWPDSYQTNGFFGGPGMQTMMSDVLQLNRDLGCAAFVLPGLMATAIDDDWLATLRATAEHAATMNVGMPLYATVALSSDSVRNTAGIQEVLAEFETLEVAGAYLLFEHPNGDYIVQDPIWLANVLELAAGLRLLKKNVVVGYANHELLCLGAASVNAIASGTWMNVRAFSPDRFLAADEEDIKRKAVWYYAPSSLSEYKPPFLDMAQQRGVLASMAPPSGVREHLRRAALLWRPAKLRRLRRAGGFPPLPPVHAAPGARDPWRDVRCHADEPSPDARRGRAAGAPAGIERRATSAPRLLRRVRPGTFRAQRAGSHAWAHPASRVGDALTPGRWGLLGPSSSPSAAGQLNVSGSVRGKRAPLLNALGLQIHPPTDPSIQRQGDRVVGTRRQKFFPQPSLD